MSYNSVPVVPSTNASDPDVATDRIGGLDFQRIKPAWGAEGTATEITDTDGGRLPVGGAQMGATNETAPASDTASSGLNGRLQRIAQRITTLITDFGTYATAFGAYATSFDAKTGGLTEAAPASDTASSGLNGRLQRIAQRLTSLIALLPTALGSTAAASSFAVTASTEDVARIGIVTEAAPASDTASSGLNGRLQRIAQRLTSLIALLPTALTSAGNFKVALLETTQTSMTYAHTQPSATNTSGAMLASNSSRKYAILTNIGTVDVYIKVNAAAVASQGILLQAYGGTYEISPSNNNFTTAAVNGITASGTATVLVAEGT